MTEADWLLSHEPSPMLRHVRGRISKRKLLLFACACATGWDHAKAPALVRLGERLADGQATADDLRAALPPLPAYLVEQVPESLGPEMILEWVDADRIAAALSQFAFLMSMGRPRARADRLRQQAAALREVVGNPFHRVAVSEAVRCFEGGLAVRLAQAIYEERDFARLPVLGDALEEAGAAAELVAHCREPGPHGRGCWVVDLLLGKE